MVHIRQRLHSHICWNWIWMWNSYLCFTMTTVFVSPLPPLCVVFAMKKTENDPKTTWFKIGTTVFKTHKSTANSQCKSRECIQIMGKVFSCVCLTSFKWNRLTPNEKRELKCSDRTWVGAREREDAQTHTVAHNRKLVWQAKLMKVFLVGSLFSKFFFLRLPQFSSCNLIFDFLSKWQS